MQPLSFLSSSSLGRVSWFIKPLLIKLFGCVAIPPFRFFFDLLFWACFFFFYLVNKYDIAFVLSVPGFVKMLVSFETSVNAVN